MNSHNDLDPQAIAQVRELTNVDEARAARLLRKYDRNVERVINHCLDDPDGLRDFELNNDDRSGANRTFYGPQTQHEVHHEPDNFPPTRPSTPIDFVYPSQYGRTGVNQRLPRYSLQDPSPYERARGEQLPSFIKLDERFDAVPGWITVIANIPAFQKAVLAAPGEDDAGPNQHHNNEWWRGQLIDANIIQPLDQFGQPENAPDSTRNIIPELRRLTAFLRSSHRAYANPIPLVQYCAIPSQHSNGIIGQVISHVVVAANDRADLDVSGMLVTTAGDGDSLRPIHHFTILSHDRHFEDFYRSLDFNFFELHSAISFDSLAPIVTLDVENDDVNGIPVGIEPPLVLHLDRYLRANQEVMGQVLQTRAEAEKDIVALQTRLKKKNPSGDLVDARKFLATTKDWLQQHLKVLTTSNDFWGELDIVNSDELKVETVDVTTIERLESAIEVELGLLDEREREITKSQAQLDLQTKQDDLLFIDSESLLPPDPDYLLELRGVIPHHSEYYFFAASVDPTDHDVGVEDDGRPLRWWEVKIRRSGSSEPDYQVVEEVNIIRVLTATKSSYGRYTLVYANQPATRGYGVSQLPTDLRSFVDKDNRVFFEEMGDYPSLQRAAAGASTDSTRAPLGTISGNRRYQGSRKSESLPVSGAAEVQPPPLPARAPPNIPSTTRRSKSRTTQDSDGFSGSQMDLARSESRRLLPGFLGGQRYTGDADVEMEDAPKGG